MEREGEGKRNERGMREREVWERGVKMEEEKFSFFFYLQKTRKIKKN